MVGKSQVLGKQQENVTYHVKLYTVLRGREAQSSMVAVSYKAGLL